MVIVTPWWLGLITFASITFAGLFAWSYYLLFRRIIGGTRIRIMIRNKDEDFLLLRKNHQELVSLISKI